MRPRMRRRTTWSTRSLPRSTTTRTTRNRLEASAGHHTDARNPLPNDLPPCRGGRHARHGGRGASACYDQSTPIDYVDPPFLPHNGGGSGYGHTAALRRSDLVSRVQYVRQALLL